MKLYIRSQNKEALVVADCVFYEEGYTYKICTNCYEATFILGFYETKERCLEIIDEIQKLLEASDPTKAFLNIECDGLLDYIEVKEIIKMARTEKAGYVPNGKKII